MLDSERFIDMSPAAVYTTLLDEGRYLCSERSMYRQLETDGQLQERRAQRRHPEYVKPQLEARAPNQVWTWDITKVPGPERGCYYSLYLAIDIYSRLAAGWTVAASESAEVAGAFLREAFERHEIQPGQLTCHSDRGAPMRAKSTALLYSDLGITASFSRPHVSDDNPYSEAAFRTLLYRPEMPARFGSLEDARVFFDKLLTWYNDRHYHSGIARLTPADVHHGRHVQIIAARQQVLTCAYALTPERFVRRAPRHPSVPAVAWINPPAQVLTQT